MIELPTYRAQTFAGYASTSSPENAEAVINDMDNGKAKLHFCIQPANLSSVLCGVQMFISI